MVRIGLGMYGLWPSEELEKDLVKISLKPVLEWKTILSEIKTLAEDGKIGYDFTEAVQRDADRHLPHWLLARFSASPSTIGEC